VIGQVLFYASPVIIPLATIQAKLSPPLVHLYMLNPLAVVLQQFRHAMVNPAAESAGNALGGPIRLVIPIAFVAALFVVGFVVFNRTAPHVAEDL
jgi:ABC-2 type transport system permease protein